MRSGRLLESAPDLRGTESNVEITSTPARGNDVSIPPCYFENATSDQGILNASSGNAEAQRLYPPIHSGRNDMSEDCEAFGQTGSNQLHASRDEHQITLQHEIDDLRRQLCAREEQLQEITKHKDDRLRRMKADFEQCMADLHRKQQQVVSEAAA